MGGEDGKYFLTAIEGGMMGRWTKWMGIEEAKERNGKLKEYGLYHIRAVKPSEKPIPIPRMHD